MSAATRRFPLLMVIAVLAASLAMPLAASAQTGTVPQLSPTVTTPKSTTTTPAKTKTPTPQLQSSLPNTGVDARILAAVGLALLLCGIGLRMRSSEERF